MYMGYAMNYMHLVTAYMHRAFNYTTTNTDDDYNNNNNG